MNKYSRGTSGGKGNKGLFYEREPKICAAGLPSKQPDLTVKDSLHYYSLQDTVDSLIRESIKPDDPPLRLPPLRRQPKRDMRNAGIYTEGAMLINPPMKTKFQTLVEDFKNTLHNSYWKMPVGTIPDPMSLPPGMRIYETTFGKPTPFHGRLYDIVMPVDPMPDKTPVSKGPGVHLDRNYCKPQFKPTATFGLKSNTDRSGRVMKCALTDDRIPLGTALHHPVNSKLADSLDAKQTQLGVALTPNDNITRVPPGFSFGKLKPPDNLPECLTTSDLNPEREKFLKCLKHLNTLRRCLFKRHDGMFFKSFYLSLKYLDQDKTGWLPKQVVYNRCGLKYVRFDPSLIEPLLLMWNAFDNEDRIKYKTFVQVINFRDPCPDLPNIPTVLFELTDYETTYSDMARSVNEIDTNFRSGTPSGRYVDLDYPITPDGYCKADRSYYPQESDVKSCINPSVFTLLGVTHRDMFAKRDPDSVRRVFEAIGENLPQDRFDLIWEEAKKYHSQGWVCFETYQRALSNFKQTEQDIKTSKV